MARAFEEFFAGYAQDPVEFLQKTFEEIEGYDEMIVLRGIRFESHCEHHMAPIIGQAWVAYVPSGRVVGISKLARVVEVYAKRLQIQEKMTAQIANSINDVLRPQGVAVVIKASHHCMTTRGVHKPDVRLLPRQSADASGISQGGGLRSLLGQAKSARKSPVHSQCDDAFPGTILLGAHLTSVN